MNTSRILAIALASACLLTAQIPVGGGGGGGGRGVANHRLAITTTSTSWSVDSATHKNSHSALIVHCFTSAGAAMVRTASSPAAGQFSYTVNATTYLVSITFGTGGNSGGWCTINGSGQGLPGATGPQGDPGPAGEDGEPGTAATIAVGTVTTGEPGTDASVTNVGTANTAVFDFVIPRGADGEGGGGPVDWDDVQNKPATIETLSGKAIVGTGANVRMSTGSITQGNAVTVDANGNLVDSGSAPGGGGGSGVTDGDKGDVIVSGGGATWTVDTLPTSRIAGLDAALAALPTTYAATSHNHDGTYAPAAQGVTGGNAHDHNGGDGGQIAYSSLSGAPTLGDAAAKNTGTTAGTLAAGDHNHTGVYQPLDADLTTLAGKTIVGSGANLRMSTGTITPGNALTIDANGNVVDSGSTPGGGGGGGALTVQQDGDAVGTRATIDLLSGAGITTTTSDTGMKVTIQHDINTAVVPTKAGDNTFAGANQFSGSVIWPSSTVAGLPAAAASTGMAYIVTDASAAGNCTSGSGSNYAICRSNGTAWVAVGDGGSGGGAVDSVDGRTGAVTLSDLYAPIAHASNTSNPHSVTKTQVGLGNVENYAIASQAEAEAGTAADKYMTPQRVAQAIAELAPEGGGGASAATIQSGELTNCVLTSSGTDDYTCDLTPAITQYTEGMRILLIPNTTSTATGGTTIAVNGLAAVEIKQPNGTSINVDNFLISGRPYTLTYRTDAFRAGPEALAYAAERLLYTGGVGLVKRTSVLGALGTASAGTDYVDPAGLASAIGAITSINGTTIPASSTLLVAADKNANNGVAGLDGNARLEAARMPALTGDVTSSAGTVATTLAAKHRTRVAHFKLWGTGTDYVLQDADDELSVFNNRLGSGITITDVACESDAGTPTLMLQRDDGTPANILAGNLTCTTSVASTTSFSGTENQIANGHRIDALIVAAGGTAKWVAVTITYTVD